MNTEELKIALNKKFKDLTYDTTNFSGIALETILIISKEVNKEKKDFSYIIGAETVYEALKKRYIDIFIFYKGGIFIKLRVNTYQYVKMEKINDIDIYWLVNDNIKKAIGQVENTVEEEIKKYEAEKKRRALLADELDKILSSHYNGTKREFLDDLLLLSGEIQFDHYLKEAKNYRN